MYRTPLSNCPHCNHLLNSLTPSLDTDAAIPAQPGDISLCERCLSILIVQNDYTPRKLTQKEFNEIPQQLYEKISRARAFLRKKRQPPTVTIIHIKKDN